MKKFRNIKALIRANLGGTTYQPTIGLHRRVVALDQILTYFQQLHRMAVWPYAQQDTQILKLSQFDTLKPLN